jgi:hypothetical protein
MRDKAMMALGFGKREKGKRIVGLGLSYGMRGLGKEGIDS